MSDPRKRGGRNLQIAKRNRPPEGEPWVWMTRELVGSPAWRNAPLRVRLVLDRLMAEHMDHAGFENGRLIATRKQLQAHGVRDGSVALAIREAEALGLIRATERGGVYGTLKRPSRYRLTWLSWREPGDDVSSYGPTNDWRHVATDSEAELALTHAAQARRPKEREIGRRAAPLLGSTGRRRRRR